MFCTARQTSQGTQRMYTASNTDYLDKNNLHQNSVFGISLTRIPDLRSQSNNFSQNFDGITNLSLLHHELSSFDDTPYLTPQATTVMRIISSHTHNDDILGYDNYDENQNTVKIN